jgi:hypothetical protein
MVPTGMEWSAIEALRRRDVHLKHHSLGVRDTAASFDAQPLISGLAAATEFELIAEYGMGLPSQHEDSSEGTYANSHRSSGRV